MQPTNVTWQQGDDLTFSLVYREGTSGSEMPVDLTGYSVRMDIVAGSIRIFTFNSATVVDVDPIEAGDQEDAELDATVGVDGSIKFHVPRALTLPGGEIYTRMNMATPVFLYNYDVFLRNDSGTAGAIPQGSQKKILTGTITVEKSYTLWL